MIRLFKYELYKVITKKLFWGILFAAIIINAIALWWLNPPPDELTHEEIRNVYDTIRQLPLSEKLEFIDEFESVMFNSIKDDSGEFDRMTLDDSFWVQQQSRIELASYIRNDLTVNTHSAFLDRVEYDANTLRFSEIFGSDPNSFSYRNIVKTQSDFEGMRNIQIRYDVNTGLEILFDSPSTDIIILLLIVVVVLALITDEKDKRLFLLVKSTSNGRLHTIVAKLFAMSVCVIGVSIITFATTAIFAEVTYGLGDITRSIQSVHFLMGSTLRISVIEFIGLHLIAKTAGMQCIAMVVMLIAIYARHSIISIATTVALVVSNTMLAAIPVLSEWSIFRFLNMFTFIRPHRVFGDYFNLNFFEHPVRLTQVFIAFGIILFVASTFAICLSFCKKRRLESNLDLFKFTPPTFKLFSNWRCFELKKLLFTNKALLILIAFIIIQVNTIRTQEEPRLSFEHHYVMHMINFLEGELTYEKESWIRSEKERFDHAHTEIERLLELLWDDNITNRETIERELQMHQNVVNSMQGFPIVYERYEYVRDTPYAQFLYDFGYIRLFGLYDFNSGLDAAMQLITVLILSLCGLFAMEYKTGMYKVLNATAFGSMDTVLMKLLLSLGLTAIAFVAASLPELIYIGRFFSFNNATMPLASVSPTEIGAMPSFMGALPIWFYIVFMLVARFAVYIGIMLIVSALSMKVRNNAYTAILAAGILLLPLFLYLFGFELIVPISLLNLTNFNGIVVSPSILNIVQIIIFITISGLCGQFIIKNFGRS